MEATLSFAFAALLGFGHAFEADHLVALGNVVTKRDKIFLAIKDGIFWGLGHTSTILIIGFIMIIGKSTFLDGYFGYFEASVGLMLILLGFFRLSQFLKQKEEQKLIDSREDNHHLAYGVGFVHGIAGSGAMVLLVMSEINGGFKSMMFLVLFGIGSIIGMLVAAGIFSLPFSKKITSNRKVQSSLVVLSSLVCVLYGSYVMYENLI